MTPPCMDRSSRVVPRGPSASLCLLSSCSRRLADSEPRHVASVRDPSIQAPPSSTPHTPALAPANRRPETVILAAARATWRVLDLGEALREREGAALRPCAIIHGARLGFVGWPQLTSTLCGTGPAGLPWRVCFFSAAIDGISQTCRAMTNVAQEDPSSPVQIAGLFLAGRHAFSARKQAYGTQQSNRAVRIGTSQSQPQGLAACRPASSPSVISDVSFSSPAHSHCRRQRQPRQTLRCPWTAQMDGIIPSRAAV